MITRRTLRHYVEEILLRKTIREGLLLALPFLIIGSIALTLQSFPIPAYQYALASVWDGNLHGLLAATRTYTLGVIPLLLIFTLSFSFGKAVAEDVYEILYYPVVAFCSFLVFTGAHGTALPITEIFNSTQTFTSIIVAILSCTIFHLIRQWQYADLKTYIKTPNTTFNIVYRMIVPAAVVILLFGLANTLLPTSFKDELNYFHVYLFNRLGINWLGMAVYVVMEQTYWFFGIHGSNVLDAVASVLLDPRMAANTAAIAHGDAPTYIFTRSFFDLFVSIGGSGSVLSLVLAIFFFGKMPHLRRLAKISLLPCIFNISEIVVIGLPIICNFIFFIPFLAVPLAFFFLSAGAMYLGWVPLVTNAVQWTTPAICSGYLATGSLSGSLLQIATISLGVFIYKPFIKKYERSETEKFKNKFKALVAEVIACEKIGEKPSFLNNSEFSDIAKVLSGDLHQAIQNKDLRLFYQPQVHHSGTIYGAEALLRWNHPMVGFVYPPLIIFLADENGFLDELGLSLIDKACHELEYISKELEHPIKISINISPPQLYNQLFCAKIRAMLKKYNFGKSIMAFELTEQIALMSTLDIAERLRELKSMGIMLSMDDFGMGHSSVMYLQDSEFDVVKLDGSLVKKVLTSERSVDIISAITSLSQKFNFKVVAEYVETEEQREKLASLGCYIYQGWLYCPAVPLDDFIIFAKMREQDLQIAAAKIE